MRILVIGAHPADPVDLAGGTVYNQVGVMDEVHLMTLTDGLFSHTVSALDLNEGWKVKREEFRKAAAVLGVESSESCYFLGLRDEPLITNETVIRDLAIFFRQLKPGMVVTHHPNEYAHWDHHVCGETVCRALKAAVKLPPTFGERPHYVPNLLFFAVQFRPEVARVGVVPQPPDVLVDLPRDAVEAKVAAMRCFVSQGHDDEAAMWRRMESFEREMGRADGLEYSEGFILGQPLKVDILPESKDLNFYKRKGV